MLRVMDLLAFPQFETFKLISDSDGLNNVVAGVGILDWETPKEIATDFSQNDFVMTTLYMSRDKLSHADAGLKALIEKRVAAIGIRTVSDNNCSKDVIEMANLYNIPIFTYKDAYMEDLIYTIKNAVFANNSNEMSLNYLKLLLEGNESRISSMARKINPMLRDNLICSCSIPTAKNYPQDLDKALSLYQKNLASHVPPGDIQNAFIRCNRCIIIIHTSRQQMPDESHLRDKLINDFFIDPSLFRTGFSHQKESLSNLKEAVNEAIISATSAVLSNEQFKTFSELGSDMLILPNISRPEFANFYNGIHSKLKNYDDAHNSHLIDTLLCYTESEGDISLTSKKMYQHGNTIRYRLEKIKSLLNISSMPDAYIQLYIFAQLHNQRLFFGEEAII